VHLRPLLEREFRFWQKRPWIKRPPYLLLLAFSGIAVLVTPFLILSGHPPEPESILPVVLVFMLGAHFFTAGGAMGIIAGEVQAGTMRLLLLTGIRPRDLVLAQFVAGLGIGAWGAMGMIPVACVGVLNSPIHAHNLLWVALLWLLTGTAANAGMLVFASLGKTVAPGTVAGLVPAVILLGNSALRPLFHKGRPTPAVEWDLMRLCGVLAAVTVAGLVIAVWRLTSADRRSAGEVSRWGWLGRWGRGGTHAGGRPGPAVRRRMLEGNPIVWLGTSRASWWMWLVVGLGLASPWWDGHAEPEELFSGSCVTRLVVLVLAAFQAFAQVRLDLREGTWESLLRTPVTVREYVLGHWLAWWHQQRGPLLAVAIVPGLLTLTGWPSQPGDWQSAGNLLLAGALLTAADAALASLWFFGAAVKCKDQEFYYASVLSAAILGIVQIPHALMGRESGWYWTWSGIAVCLTALSYGIIWREIRMQLDEAAGLKVRSSFEVWG
jgi:hypothetical protein